MSPCDLGNHVLCCHPCDCDCHDEHAAAALDAQVTATTAHLERELADLLEQAHR